MPPSSSPVGFVVAALLFQTGLKRIHHALSRRLGYLQMLKALEEEFLMLGAFSLVLEVAEHSLEAICVPCTDPSQPFCSESALAVTIEICPDGQTPLFKPHALHSVHLLIFVVAVCYVFYLGISLGVALVKLRQYRACELAVQDARNRQLELPIYRRHLTTVTGHRVLHAVGGLFRDRVTATTYLCLRAHVVTRLGITCDFDFRDYVTTTIEDHYARFFNVGAYEFALLLVWASVPWAQWIMLFLAVVVFVACGLKLNHSLDALTVTAYRQYRIARRARKKGSRRLEHGARMLFAAEDEDDGERAERTGRRASTSSNDAGPRLLAESTMVGSERPNSGSSHISARGLRPSVTRDSSSSSSDDSSTDNEDGDFATAIRRLHIPSPTSSAKRHGTSTGSLTEPATQRSSPLPVIKNIVRATEIPLEPVDEKNKSRAKNSRLMRKLARTDTTDLAKQGLASSTGDPLDLFWLNRPLLVLWILKFAFFINTLSLATMIHSLWVEAWVGAQVAEDIDLPSSRIGYSLPSFVLVIVLGVGFLLHSSWVIVPLYGLVSTAALSTREAFCDYYEEGGAEVVDRRGDCSSSTAPGAEVGKLGTTEGVSVRSHRVRADGPSTCGGLASGSGTAGTLSGTGSCADRPCRMDDARRRARGLLLRRQLNGGGGASFLYTPAARSTLSATLRSELAALSSAILGRAATQGASATVRRESFQGPSTRATDAQARLPLPHHRHHHEYAAESFTSPVFADGNVTPMGFARAKARPPDGGEREALGNEETPESRMAAIVAQTGLAQAAPGLDPMQRRHPTRAEQLLMLDIEAEAGKCNGKGPTARPSARHGRLGRFVDKLLPVALEEHGEKGDDNRVAQRAEAIVREARRRSVDGGEASRIASIARDVRAGSAPVAAADAVRAARRRSVEAERVVEAKLAAGDPGRGTK